MESLVDTEQILHVQIRAKEFKVPLFFSAVYGKCTGRGRQILWRSMRDIAGNMDGVPWIVGRDFNIFATEEERRGTTPCSRINKKEMLEFVETIGDSSWIPGVMEHNSHGREGNYSKGLIGSYWLRAGP